MYTGWQEVKDLDIFRDDESTKRREIFAGRTWDELWPLVLVVVVIAVIWGLFLD